jgi:hypothetical protein
MGQEDDKACLEKTSIQRPAKQRSSFKVRMLMFASISIPVCMFVGSVLADECPKQVEKLSSILAKVTGGQVEQGVQSETVGAQGDSHFSHEEILSTVFACGTAITQPESIQKHSKRLSDALVSTYNDVKPVVIFLFGLAQDATMFFFALTSEFVLYLSNIEYVKLFQEAWQHLSPIVLSIVQAAASIPPLYQAIGSGFAAMFFILWRLFGFRKALIWTTTLSVTTTACCNPHVQRCASEIYFIGLHLAAEVVSCVSSRGSQCAFISSAEDMNEGNPPQVVFWIRTTRAWISALKQNANHLQVLVRSHISFPCFHSHISLPLDAYFSSLWMHTFLPFGCTLFFPLDAHFSSPCEHLNYLTTRQDRELSCIFVHKKLGSSSIDMLKTTGGYGLVQ